MRTAGNRIALREISNVTYQRGNRNNQAKNGDRDHLNKPTFSIYQLESSPKQENIPYEYSDPFSDGEEYETLERSLNSISILTSSTVQEAIPETDVEVHREPFEHEVDGYPKYPSTEAIRHRRPTNAFAETEQQIEKDALIDDIIVFQDYGVDIATQMRRLESRLLPDFRHLFQLSEYTLNTRKLLFNWMTYAHGCLGFVQETLFLAFNLVDRSMSVDASVFENVCIVGAAALFIAGKYEEVQTPAMKEILQLLDGKVSHHDICRTELQMLALLGYEIGWSGPMPYIRKVAHRLNGIGEGMQFLLEYLTEVAYMDSRFLPYTPSQIVFVCCWAALIIADQPDDFLFEVENANVTTVKNDHRFLLETLFDALRQPWKHHRVTYAKYSQEQRSRISQAVFLWFQRGDAPGRTNFASYESQSEYTDDDLLELRMSYRTIPEL
ncbi:G2/mitotic-specific cyclin cig1 [Schizosaccharomyces japonicus yFS275]|uniref:G2/mitotic-specific cyclin cig1 n=1 Tax=Schizosaccharomyces japonicus (strain yFS275 / FY16936) TaxID=402676 RepID=B6K4G5_SCHJY|nr:G2/mitotic-specific cyclin cig1 [Schizosaccharomyces japonicus yFS275]EEB08372.1 G2/mitotic-specific cyclin cig1 [Schizosaccharomyces japonicus yFS275]